MTRTWTTVALSSGSAVVDLDDAPTSLVRVRVGDHDGPVHQPVQASSSAPEVVGFCANCTGQDFLDKAVAGTTYDVAQTLGLQAAQIRTTTRFSGTLDADVANAAGLDGADDKAVERRLYVALSRLPEGQVVRSAYIALLDTKDRGALMQPESGVPIAAATAEQQPFTLSARTSDGSQHKVQVFSPGAARVQLVSNAPSRYPDTAKVALAGGTAVLTTPGWDEQNPPYRVSTFDASGDLIGTWPLELPNRDDPYDVRP